MYRLKGATIVNIWGSEPMNRGLGGDNIIYVKNKGGTSSIQEVNYSLIWSEIWKIRTPAKVPENVEF